LSEVIEKAKKCSSNKVRWMYYDANDLQHLANEIRDKGSIVEATPGAADMMNAAAELVDRVAMMRVRHAKEVENDRPADPLDGNQPG
jgi:hypothetical protein